MYITILFYRVRNKMDNNNIRLIDFASYKIKADIIFVLFFGLFHLNHPFSSYAWTLIPPFILWAMTFLLQIWYISNLITYSVYNLEQEDTSVYVLGNCLQICPSCNDFRCHYSSCTQEKQRQ